MAVQESPCRVWCFTSKADGLEPDTIKEILTKNCTSWAFQKEEGESGYIHYQGELQLLKKRRLTDIYTLIPGGTTHWTPKSNGAIKKGVRFSYVLKDDTRIAGPWTDQNPDGPEEMPAVLKDYRPYPWRTTITGMMREKCPSTCRLINILIDGHGGAGKSTFKKWLAWQRLASIIEPQPEQKHVEAAVMTAKTKRAFVIDTPRTSSPWTAAGTTFWAAIERIKDGTATEHRNSHKAVFFDTPHIWVFTNTMPNMGALSPDRWRFWLINHKNELVEYTNERARKLKEIWDAVDAAKRKAAPKRKHDELDDVSTEDAVASLLSL